MSVYDKEKIDSDELSHITGIDADEEKAIEDRAYSGAAEDIEKGTGLDSDVLKSAEEEAGTPLTTEADNKEKTTTGNDDQVGEGYKDEAGQRRRIRARIVTRRNAVTGGAIALLIGGSFGAFTMIQGPLQFIHIAQLLQRFHFASVEDNGNSRTLKLYKWAKNTKTGSRENLRLGIIGTRIAESMDAKLKTVGLEKTYKQGVGTATYDGMILEAKTFSEKAVNGEQFKRLDEDGFIAKFKESYNIDITSNGDGTFKIPPEEGALGGFFKNRSFNKVIVGETGTDGIAGGLSARVMGKRDGVTWHPIRRLDSKITGTIDQRFAAWLKEMKQRINSGADDAGLTATGEQKDDPNNSGKKVDDPTSDAAAAEAEKAGHEAAEKLDDGQGGTDGLISRFTESSTGKGVIGATAIVGILCTAKALSDGADSLKHDLVVLPLIRKGMQAISLGNQVMSFQDLDLQQLGFFSKELNDPETGSWANGRSIQAELGQEQTGPDIPDEANVKKLHDGSAFSEVINAIPLLGLTCRVSESFVGKTLNFVVSLTTPVATGLTMAVTSTGAFKDAVAGVIRWMAGSPVPTMVFGATFGNYVNYGARLGSNDTKVALGGKALTADQSAALKLDRAAADTQEIKSQSFAQRIFDPYSPDSLISKAIDSYSSNVGSGMASMLTNVLNPLKNIGTIFTPLTRKIKAATLPNYDYGFPEYGFSLDELNSANYDDPYSNANKVIATLNIPCEIDGKPNHPCGQDYINQANKCFGVMMSPDGTIDSGLNTQIDVLDKEYPSYCADSNPTWTQIRFYILDMKTAESMDCFISGDTNSCQQVSL